MAEYSSQKYWDNRYSKEEEPFEWFQTFHTLKTHLVKYMRKGDQVLNVGCGNSELSEKLYDTGFTSIVNADYSKVLIKKMKKKYENRPGMTFLSLDVTKKLPFPKNNFDIILDKGTFDSIFAGINQNKVVSMLSEINRVMKRTGKFILVSYNDFENKKELFKPFDWVVKTIPLEKPSFSEIEDDDKYHYLFIIQKKSKSKVFDLK